ncbi:hypothetical protein PAXINDRAFT_7019 [Paxillus involutus ATCC 200175]|nr:hypothetical protein PAXINDRAFT_7019 [Paxillus involutus ATCC 200175]
MATLNNVVTEVFQEQFTKYMNVAALSAFLFDYCLTVSSEVHYVWGRKWEMTRIVFTISRYLTFVASAMTCYSSFRPFIYKSSNDLAVTQIFYTATKLATPLTVAYASHRINLPSATRCSGSLFGSAICIVCVISAEMILILRTYALWGRSRRVLAILIPLVVVGVSPRCIDHLDDLKTIPGARYSRYARRGNGQILTTWGLRIALPEVFCMRDRDFKKWWFRIRFLDDPRDRPSKHEYLEEVSNLRQCAKSNIEHALLGWDYLHVLDHPTNGGQYGGDTFCTSEQHLSLAPYSKSDLILVIDAIHSFIGYRPAGTAEYLRLSDLLQP